ncbi:hypothetical protein IGI04_026280 [Brassica rapa subsp. trilocularis]|uniref:Uncharacterized protein n=1 Tax=Brassica rapa subsp. trilocularis TaxID=1813537 RepID=A0ABQ7KVU9_BRACM|nr:hypothetical protein IGI04_026280 [Brassica rapa subsp. trilocularis]
MSSESSESYLCRNRESRSGSPHRLEATPYMSFESSLEATRVFFVSNAPVPNPWSLRHYHYLYKLCSLNWLPGFDNDSMIKTRLQFLYTLVRKKPIYSGRLVYDQVLEISRSSDADTKITLPNLIYQTLILQRNITALPGDEPLIGNPLCINGAEVDTHIQRGKRRGRARLG